MTATRRFSTFTVSGRLYGMDVMKVQEITKTLPMTKVPLAPDYVYGLINLRGQISTAVGLRELFGIKGETPLEQMNVVCKIQDVLISFLVDQIGDVVDLDETAFEEPPDTISESMSRFLDGVYKMPGQLLSVISVDKIGDVILKANASQQLSAVEAEES
jgi:purine-binding chemotaxis protein CheW